MKKYSFKEFSILSSTTLRTLRYYETLNLITTINGKDKKYIEEDNLIKLQTIQLLKNVGYTLEEIKEIIKNKNIEEQIILQKDLLNIQLTKITTMLSLIEELNNQSHMNVSQIYKTFLEIRNKQNLQLQFQSSEGLKTRVAFHHQHTHYKDNFHQWMYQHYQFNKNDKVLEIGCGDGTLWDCNKEKILADISIILSDISLNMIEDAQIKLKDIPQIIRYDYADCLSLPYPNESFDIVIINHVLMYLEDSHQALKEIYRILKPGGYLYCSTIGKDMMKEREKLIKTFDSQISFDQNLLYQHFGDENGKEKLSCYFQHIDYFERKEVYMIKDVDSFYQFILSGKGLSFHVEPLYKKKKQFYNYLQDYFKKNNGFSLTIHAGMFKARKGKENGEDKIINI